MCNAIDNKYKVWYSFFVHFHNDLISEITHLITRQNENQVEKMVAAHMQLQYNAQNTFTFKRYESYADNVRHLYDNFMLIYAGRIIAITAATATAAANMTSILRVHKCVLRELYLDSIYFKRLAFVLFSSQLNAIAISLLPKQMHSAFQNATHELKLSSQFQFSNNAHQ